MTRYKTMLRFRIWDKRNKRFIKGYQEADSWFKGFGHDNKDERNIGLSFWEITDEDFIILLSTGLKDKNGVEIFEGDILKTSYNDVYDFAHYEVIYKEDKAQFWCKCVALHHKDLGFQDLSHRGYCEGSLDCEDGLEVIGNKFENPELLK